MRTKTIATCTRSLATDGTKSGIRLGARSLHDFRSAVITFGDSVGSCEAQLLPGTRVLAQTSASIAEPADARPGEGSLTISVWLSPAATGEMVGTSEKPSSIARTLERLFKDNRAVDLESLCIKFGELAWLLRVDVHILEMNGCLQEAAALAVLGALMTYQRPQAHIDPDTEELVVLSLAESNPVELHLFHLPTLTSFALCDNKLLAEPFHEEEEIFPGKLLIGINDSKELCHLHLTNPIEKELLLEATLLSQNHCLARIGHLKSRVDELKAERDVPLYKRPPGPRDTGAEISLSEIKEKLVKSSSGKGQSKSNDLLVTPKNINILQAFV